MTYLIHGATGAQGSPVLAALTALGHSATAAVRGTTEAPAPSVAVDLTSVDSLTAAYRGVDGVFVHLPVGPPDAQMAAARAVAAAVTEARPARVVLSTSGYATGDDTTSPLGFLAHALADGGVSHAVVEPRLFLENLLLPPVHAAATGEGVLRYPLRTDYSVSWASHLDVADVVARLLTDHTVSGVVSVGALPGLLGDDLAAGFARHYQRHVTFEAIDPATFGELIIPMFGAAAAQPVIDSYTWRATQGDDVVPRRTSAQQLLGLTPRSVEDWLRDVGA